jgi:hypothetical protein
MAGGGRGRDTAWREGLAAVGVAVFAVVCCAGLPLLAALAGGVALGTLLGVGAGVFAALVAGGVLIAQGRRRHGAATAVGHPRPYLRHRENRR